MKLTSEIKKQPGSIVDIIAELSAEDFMTYRGKAVQNLAETFEIKGFRKGNVPEDMLIKQLGDGAILDEMAQLAISAAYVQIIKEHKLNAIGRPEISVTKLANNNPLGFTITTSIMPELDLPDYKKVAHEVMNTADDIDVTDAEVTEAIDHLLRMRAGAQNTCDHDHAEGESCEDKVELPVLDDAFVKSLGDFKDVEDFKNKLKENIAEEKQARAGEKKRIATLEKIMEQTKVEIPDILTNYEIDKMMHQMEHDIAMSGLKFDEYLEKIKKTKENLRNEWKDTGSKRALMHLVINTIAEKEKLEPSHEAVEAETQKMMEQYKDMKEIEENNVRLYVVGILTNQKVFEFLEAQK
jgi:trigger factor